MSNVRVSNAVDVADNFPPNVSLAGMQNTLQTKQLIIRTFLAFTLQLLLT